MAMLPLRDRVGTAVVDVRFATEAELVTRADWIPLPLSLIVVTRADTVLMMRGAQRGHWELPGGTREQGESARQAAVRELTEQTGLGTTDLDCAAMVEFDLRQPTRREYAAVYRTQLLLMPQLLVNDEAVDFRWWNPRSSPSDDTNPPDAEIGKRVCNPGTHPVNTSEETHHTLMPLARVRAHADERAAGLARCPVGEPSFSP
jgi:8-oxo-dGTP diphosphatase